ncbi:type II toxin-antitoxin system VapC family toxin [soil metagenome]|nr:type II toxin-antitoxin system VapC family toxin [Thermoleophilaceae bacterium]MDQ3320029.1 type II toxin-antitoxin system VapC family toxin [Actinomycetota bacterium]MDQ3355182.1 type II toxin-antitoxin system VapC family toxin [Actinomycetota bacterium]
MIVADTSVAVAGFARWHEWHAAARVALREGARLVAHSALETYSVLTRLPPPNRVSGVAVRDYLERSFSDSYLTLRPRDQRLLVPRLVELEVAGGAVYDALIALTAASAGASLLTCDRRARETYQRCGVDAHLLGR